VRAGFALTNITDTGQHDGERREAQIARFAHAHGWRLRYYRDGFCAIFDEEPRRHT
jgi:hypothetical protein